MRLVVQAVIVGALAMAAPAAYAAQSNEGAVSYPASFFADARPNTVMDMISRLPGFSFDGGAQVRGFAGAAGNVIIDGQRPTTKQDDLESVLRRIPASQVDHIDIIRGGAPGIDMQGRTLLANVVRKKGSGAQLVVAPVLDALPKDGRIVPTLRLEATRRQDGKALEAALVMANYFDDGAGSGPHTHYDSPSSTDPNRCLTTCPARLSAKAGGFQATATAAYETPLAGGTFRVNGLLFDNNYLDREHDVFQPASHNDVTHFNQDAYKAELGTHYSRKLTDRATLDVLALQQDQRRVSVSDFRQFSHSRFRESDNLSESIASATLRYKASDSLSLVTSAEGAYNVQTSKSAYVQDGVAIPLPAANVRVEESRGEVAANATWTPMKAIAIEAGAKLEASSISASGDVSHKDSLSYPKPRLVVTWTPDDLYQARLRVEREVGQLDFSAFVASSALNTTGNVHVGNPSLTPQDVWVYEATLERKFWKSGDLTLTVRHLDIANAVDRVTDGAGNDLAGNIGDATENDLIADLTAPLDPFHIPEGLLKVHWTWRDSEATDPTTHLRRPLSQLHPADGEVEFTQDLKALKAQWSISAFTGWKEAYYRFNEVDSIKLSAWVQFAYEYKPAPDSSLRFEFNNALNRPLRQVYTVYNGARPSTLGSVDYRNQRTGPELHLRYRHTFG